MKLCSLPWEKSRLLRFMRQQIQLWQHYEGFASTIMFVVRLHPRLLKVLPLNLKTRGSVLNQQKRVFERPKESRPVENIETVRLSVIETLRKHIGNVIRH